CPFAAVTVALLLAVAMIAVKLSRDGGETSCHRAPPSSVRTMVPDLPTIQHTSLDGAEAASRSVVTPLRSVSHALEFPDRKIAPPIPNCHTTLPSGEEI